MKVLRTMALLFIFTINSTLLWAVADVGTKAYNFKLESVDGDTMALSDYRGKIVLVDFWATWCPPCRYEIPRLVELKKKFKKEPFEIIGVNLDISPKNAKYLKSFMKKYSINYPVLYDNGRMGAIFGIRSIPQTFIIDENGVIVKKYIGFYPGMEKEIEKVIEENINRLKKSLAEEKKNESEEKDDAGVEEKSKR